MSLPFNSYSMPTDGRAIALMLESDGPGGAEVVVLQLGEELARRGYRVIPVGPANRVGWLSQKFREVGLETRLFTARHPLDPRWVSDLATIMREERVDVVHSHEFTMAVFGSLAARRLNLPHVITMHGAQKMTHALRRRVAVRWAIRHSDATMAVSEATKQQLDEDLGMSPSEISIIRNGVPIRVGQRTPVRNELGVQEDELLILAVGNLDERKGHLILLRALQQLECAGLQVPWKLAIAGGRGGPEREKLVAYAAAHGLAGRLHILTYREDIPDLLAAADIFTMPSLWEGLPLAMLEAMLAAKPVLASDTSGIPEAVTHNVHGLLTIPGDADSVASALRSLLTDEVLRRRLGEAARARGMAEFTIGAMADRYEQLYSAGLSRRGVTRPALAGRA